ncbi:cilia- and flagella-associated protein 77 [Heliangelus exortis]|uniref:cilia- and flagella-associated protein 77 n=1 Tax=Heliangelus exortis TaxID=472823 RepID=UPI003A8D039C
MAGDSTAPPRRPLCLAEVEPGTENERLGVARDSMLRNPLILKAEVGKPPRNCYTLPGLDFAYGLYIPRTDGGVPEAIGNWNSIKPGTRFVEKMPRDFITMNRGALRDGCLTARDFQLYYKTKDIRRKSDKPFKTCPPKALPDMTFGIPTRSSSPFYDLLHHKYREQWLEEQRALTVAEQMEKKKKLRVRETRTTLLRKQPQPVEEESFWHLPHLEKVGPHLSTFPNPETRKKAFSASR